VYCVNSTSRVLIAWATIVLVLAALLSFTAYAPEAQGVGESCSGKDVYPSQRLSRVAEDTPSGTTFCLHDGTYKISRSITVQNGDVFMGVYSDSTRPSVTTDRAHHIFSAYSSEDATIKNLTVSGAVGSDRCEPKCGRGIGGGNNLTVVNVRATHNMNAGIGAPGPGTLVQGSILDHNGSRSFSALDGGPSSAAGIKSTSSFTLMDSYVHDNWWNGVWCDGECNTFTVKDSTITDNGKVGIVNEKTTGPALITGNIIKRNGRNEAVSALPRTRAGLLIINSTNADINGNIFGRNYHQYGIYVHEGKPPPDVSGISIHENTMNGDRINGCGLSGVTCKLNN
jgi:hypothetical protein